MITQILFTSLLGNGLYVCYFLTILYCTVMNTVSKVFSKKNEIADNNVNTILLY